MHTLGDLSTALTLDYGDVVLALQIEPKLRAVAEIAPEPDGGIGRDGASPVENVGDAAGELWKDHLSTAWRSSHD